MYEKHWGLVALPFQNLPDPRVFFPSSQHRRALGRLAYAAQHGKGAALLTGEIGCGKTTLTWAFILQLAEDQYDVGVVTNPSLPPRDFLDEVNLQLGVSASGTKLDLLRALSAHLMRNVERGKATVLIVDEGQGITDPAVFEELRMLLNFQLNDRFLLSLVLVGQPELQGRVAAIPQLDQRIAIRCHLAPLDAEESLQYITFRLKKAGATRGIFTEEAMRLVHQHTRGIPRSINTLCDLCLLEGYLAQASGVDGATVRRVAQQGR